MNLRGHVGTLSLPLLRQVSLILSRRLQGVLDQYEPELHSLDNFNIRGYIRKFPD
jgi:hypothetical protein